MRRRLRALWARYRQYCDRENLTLYGTRQGVVSAAVEPQPEPQPAYHCTICNIDWPHFNRFQFRAWCKRNKKKCAKDEEGYEHCPYCGEETSGIAATSVPAPHLLDPFEAYKIKQEERFNVYLEAEGRV